MRFGPNLFGPVGDGAVDAYERGLNEMDEESFEPEHEYDRIPYLMGWRRPASPDELEEL